MNGLSKEAFAALASPLRIELKKATTDADIDLLLTLIEKVRDRDTEMADALENLARNFEYEKILNLIQQAGPTK